MPAAVAQIAGALGKSNGNTEGVYNFVSTCVWMHSLYVYTILYRFDIIHHGDSTNADEGCKQQKIGDCTKVLPSGKLT